MKTHLTKISMNRKTGPIPVSTSSRETCPDACPLKGNGCYAESGPMMIHWHQVNLGTRGLGWQEFLEEVRKFPPGELWRHNQAGDLPGIGNDIDVTALGQLVHANQGRAGWTYSHKPMTSAKNRRAINEANENGFTINLSADTLKEADELAELKIAPVVVVLPIDSPRSLRTPAGRIVMVCPAEESEHVTCARCKICQKRDRGFIVGFRAHGTGKAKVEAIAKG